MNLNPYIYSQNLMQKAEMETFKKEDSFRVMQKAAKTCFNFIIDIVSNQRILVVCGPGNNGGDGILIAKYLYDKQKNVELYAPLGMAKTDDSSKALALLNSSFPIKQSVNLEDYDIIIDSVFGVGLSRPITKELQILFQDLNDSRARVISIDMPSGVQTDTGQVDSVAIKADTTLTFHRLKPGHLLLPGKEYAGTIKLLDIQLENLDNQTKIFLNTPPPIKKINNADHKYSRGTSYIIAGTQLIGASKLAALAASQSSLRSGAGLSKLLIAKTNQEVFKPHLLEEMMMLYDNQKKLFEIIQKTKITSLIFGCGIDINQDNLELLRFLLDQPINLVLDASAFSLIEQDKPACFDALYKREATTILTPHKGEFEKVFENTNDKIHDCINAAKQTNSIILYKGSDTVIGTPSCKAYLNHSSSPHLATAGSGDVLAGLIGGLLAQEYKGVEATKLACYIHSQCGIRLGQGLIASDLIKEIPKVLINIDSNN
ncbi:uncharacterized protein METZ01_LOCUS107109 [marine metagenome]|uniref:Nicotinamide nucleotide repair protein n=1 Tax=marine metagenome TaxID=408172 RepID=A0A381WP49_9ZZZZ